MADNLGQCDDGYESAEAAYLDAIRGNGSREDLTALAQAVARRADAWNTQAHREFFATGEPADLDALTERTEVLAELWSDIASAHEAATGRGT
ncbi:hypothetical protein [Solicola sp. PLA-1-18]|uniref:hypothetical protein n=1 Tax=Solicola sp. PLA-1-18 TaxID=3380532 RepID=UPI003B81B41D